MLVSPENQKPLRVVSYNIQGQAARKTPGHLAKIAETIVSLNPDIAGLQEVHRKTSHSRGDDQAETLERLTGMKMFFGRCCENWGGELIGSRESSDPADSSASRAAEQARQAGWEEEGLTGLLRGPKPLHRPDRSTP